ncbi:uncharacterized protein LOC142162171 [Nicotiana tabacum]|uniref:Uncharacterized protein LOC142162171 n=1 Tax=Nicotiana tabacum TaxID=4097 RepID=A0AC58RPE5_TOBAC
MKLALREKSKLGFVDETYVKSTYRGELAEQWEKCNAIVLSWTGSTVSNELMPSIVYASNARKDLWDELDVLVPLSSCDCGEARHSIEHLRSQHVVQFLMGLNETYSNIRSNVLAKRPVVTINEAYEIVTQEENQRALGVVDTHKEPLTMLAGKGPDFRGKRPGIICEHCGYKGNLKENCFKIIGYPVDFKSKRKNQTG